MRASIICNVAIGIAMRAAIAIGIALSNTSLYAQSCPPGTACDQFPTGTIAPATQPAATQNTVTTSGPVNSETTISVGTIASQVLNWVWAAVGAIIIPFAVNALLKLAARVGIQNVDALRARLVATITNGANLAVKEGGEELKLLPAVEVKNQTEARIIQYVQAHGAETIRALGLEPTSPRAVEAIKAQLATAISDPSVPTPKILDPIDDATKVGF